MKTHENSSPIADQRISAGDGPMQMKSPPPFQLFASGGGGDGGEGGGGGSLSELAEAEGQALSNEAALPSNAPALQLSKIEDYKDVGNAKHDPGHLSDAEIKDTDEFKALMAKYVKVASRFVEADVVLACKLAIRDLRQGKVVDLSTQGQAYLIRAADQKDAASGAEGLKNKLEWVPFNSGQAAADPSQLESEFSHWLLMANKAEPSDVNGKMNCWELVMYGAFKAGIVTEAELKATYALAVQNVKDGKYFSVGLTFEEVTKASAPITYNIGDKDSPRPLRGDIVVLENAPTHACIATGKMIKNPVTGKDEAQVISLWTPNGKKVESTTIEKLDQQANARPILFWSAKW